MRQDRRSFLASLGAAGALAACGGNNVLSSPGNASGVSESDRLWHPRSGSSKMLPLKIINRTPYPDDDIWFITTGQKTPDDPARNKYYPWWWLKDANTGELAQIQPSDEVGGETHYSINLAKGTKNGDMMLPEMFGGARMYFSVKNKIKLQVAKIANSPYHTNTIPNNWNTTGNNAGVLFDWWEFVNVPGDPTQGFNANLTQVDIVGIPMSIRAFGADLPSSGKSFGFPSGARSAIFKALKGLKAWEKLVRSVGGNDLVAVAPFHGIENGTFASDYFQPYIDAVWKYYAASTGNKLQAQVTDGVFFVGTVTADGNFTFTKQGSPSAKFAKPNTFQVFANQVNAMGGGVPGNQIQGAFAPAFNRTTLLLSKNLGIITAKPACSFAVKNKYQPYKGLTNFYAKAIHANALDNLAYAFGNDDNCSDSSFVASRKPTKAVVTLEAF